MQQPIDTIDQLKNNLVEVEAKYAKLQQSIEIVRTLLRQGDTRMATKELDKLVCNQQ